MIYKLNIDAFAVTPEFQAVAEQARDDRQFAKSKFNVFPGGLGAAITYYQDHPTPQVILVEDVDDKHLMIERLGALAEVCEPGTKVIVVGAANDILIYRTLISQGVSEYLVAPVSARQIIEAVETIFADPSSQPRGRLITFYGARGGVGSSSVAHNVAWSLSQAIADEVILIDLDLAFGTAGLAFNIDTKQTVVDVLAQPERIDVVLLERFLVKYDDHLQVLSAPGDLRAMYDIAYEGLDRLLDFARQMAPYVVVDCPHIWSPWTAALLSVSEDVVVVAQPDLPNLRDCKNLMDSVVSKRSEAYPTRLVLNRVDAFKKTQLTAKDFEDTLNLAPLASIPFDPVVFGTAMNNGQMIGEAAKGHKIAESFRQLALQLTGRTAVSKKKQADLLGWLKKAK